MTLPARIHDLTGRRFGRLTAIAHAGLRNAKSHWHCRCDCGERRTVSSQALRGGHSTSCGCFRREASRRQLEKNIAASGLPRGAARFPWARRNAA